MAGTKGAFSGKRDDQPFRGWLWCPTLSWSSLGVVGPPLEEEAEDAAWSGRVDTGGMGWRLRAFASASLSEPFVRLLKRPERLLEDLDFVEGAITEAWSLVEAFEHSDLSDRLPEKTATRRRMVGGEDGMEEDERHDGDGGQEVYDDDKRESMSMNGRQKLTGSDAQTCWGRARG